MKKYSVIFLFTMTCLLASYGCYYDNKEDLYQYFDQTACDLSAITYSGDILPIMELHCLPACHDANSQQGNINLEGHANIKIYGENGQLYGSMIHDAAYSIMPPSGQILPQCDLDKVKTWIDAGMPNN